jgi:hypothetical protein
MGICDRVCIITHMPRFLPSASTSPSTSNGVIFCSLAGAFCAGVLSGIEGVDARVGVGGFIAELASLVGQSRLEVHEASRVSIPRRTINDSSSSLFTAPTSP